MKAVEAGPASLEARGGRSGSLALLYSSAVLVSDDLVAASTGKVLLLAALTTQHRESQAVTSPNRPDQPEPRRSLAAICAAITRHGIVSPRPAPEPRCSYDDDAEPAAADIPAADTNVDSN